MPIRGRLRTLKLELESKLGKYVPTDHPCIPRLLEHAALLLNVKSLGSDGLMSWAQARGRCFAQKMLCFAQAILVS